MQRDLVAERLDEFSEWCDTIGTFPRVHPIEQRVRSGPDEERAHEDRLQAPECTSPRNWIESVHVRDDETARRWCIDVDLASRRGRETTKICCRLALEALPALREERNDRPPGIRQRGDARLKRSSSRSRAPQTFSVAWRFFSSAGTGRPCPKPGRFGSVGARVSAEGACVLAARDAGSG